MFQSDSYHQFFFAFLDGLWCFARCLRLLRLSGEYNCLPARSNIFRNLGAKFALRVAGRRGGLPAGEMRRVARSADRAGTRWRGE
jgi:hypothetical protein